MQIIADVNKVLKTAPRNLTFTLNVLSESSIHFIYLRRTRVARVWQSCCELG